MIIVKKKGGERRDIRFTLEAIRNISMLTAGKQVIIILPMKTVLKSNF